MRSRSRSRSRYGRSSRKTNRGRAPKSARRSCPRSTSHCHRNETIWNWEFGIWNSSSIPNSSFQIPNCVIFPLRRVYAVPLPNQPPLILGDRALVMGILNVTPDSFAEASARLDSGGAIEAALRMEADGADLIDVGGESTRPGAEPVSAEDELARVLPVVDGLARQLRVPISVDTYKADVARAVLDRGAAIVNDVSGL